MRQRHTVSTERVCRVLRVLAVSPWKTVNELYTEIGMHDNLETLRARVKQLEAERLLKGRQRTEGPATGGRPAREFAVQRQSQWGAL